MKWYSNTDANAKNLKFGKIYLVHILRTAVDEDHGQYRYTRTYLGKFNGDRWNIADYDDYFIWQESIKSTLNYEVTEFANLPKFHLEDLISKPTNGRYLISVKYRGRKRYRTMIGMLIDNCWSVGDLKEAFDLYTDEIDDIKAILI